MVEKTWKMDPHKHGSHILTLCVGNRWEIVYNFCADIKWAKVLSQFGLG
jgi:hypothetical protein